MKTSRSWLIAILFVSASVLSPIAAASDGPGWSLAGMWGGVDYSMPTSSAGSLGALVSLPSGGLVFDVDLGIPWLSLAMDALYVQRAWSDPVGNISEGVIQNNLQLRFWPAQHWFGIGVGAYSAFGMNFAVDGTSSPNTAYGINPWDIGLTGSLFLNFRINENWSIIWDNRYTYGLLNVAIASGAGFQHHDFMSMLGVRFAMSNESW
ncbi:MAG: hypothetical protein ACXWP5_08875 [Bdellovibrionota bacterium]